MARCGAALVVLLLSRLESEDWIGLGLEERVVVVGYLNESVYGQSSVLEEASIQLLAASRTYDFQQR